MTQKRHKVTTVAQGRHAPYGWEEPAAVRATTSVVADDLRRHFLETDTGAVYELSAVGPGPSFTPTWRRVDGARPNATTTNDGYMTQSQVTLLNNTAALIAAQVAESDQDEQQIAALAAALQTEQALLAPLMTWSAAAPIVVYVSNSGDDTAAGTQAAPLKTIATAWTKLPQIQTGPFIVHLAAGTYAYSPPPSNIQRSVSAFVALVGDDFTNVLTGTVVAGSSNATLKTSGLTASALIGNTLEMTSGAASGCRRLINENTTADVALDFPLTNSSSTRVAAATGDTFKVVRPAVTLTFTANQRLHGGIAFHLINVATAGGNFAVSPSHQPNFLLGVELGDGLGCEINSAQLFAGTVNETQHAGASYSALVTALGLTLSPLAWQGWGVSGPGATFIPSQLTVPQGAFRGFFCSLGGGIASGIGPDAAAIFRGGRLYTIVGFWGSVSMIQETPFYLCPMGASFYFGANLIGNMRLFSQGDIVIKNLGNCGVLCLSRGASFTCRGSLTGTSALASAGGGVLAFEAGGGRLIVEGACTISAPTAAAFYVYDEAEMQFGSLTASCGYGSTMLGGSLRTDALSLTASVSGPVLTLRQSARVTLGRDGVSSSACVISGPAAGSGALLVTGAAVFNCTYFGSLAITNTSTAANSDGVRCVESGRAVFGLAPTISSAGSSGYGVNCRGGGRATFPSQPNGVTGPTADFTVGSNSGDDFARTALNVAYAARVSGGSAVLRTA